MSDLQLQQLRDQTLYSSISKHWHFHTLPDIHLLKIQQNKTRKSSEADTLHREIKEPIKIQCQALANNRLTTLLLQSIPR